MIMRPGSESLANLVLAFRSTDIQKKTKMEEVQEVECVKQTLPTTSNVRGAES